MQILLISVYEGLISFGLRCLSAVLKEAGVQTNMVFLPRETEGFRSDGFRYHYPQKVLDQLAELAQNADLIGISVMSNYVENAVEITRRLHKTSRGLVIWGGIHPTIRPEECLDYADLVCVGEGEDALLELARQLERGEGFAGVRNIWSKQDGKVVPTPLRPLVANLDRFPYPDYDLQDQYVLHLGKIQPLTEELLYYYLSWPYASDQEPVYTTLMSRGCTWNCTYCNNNALRVVYHEDWKVRRRSVANFVGELKNVVTRYPGIKMIKIEDDVFLDNLNTVCEFAALYKQALSTPLYVTGFQPSSVNEEKVGLLVDAGMKRVRMGVQTGSIDIMHGIYKRPGSIQQLHKAFAVFHKFGKQIDPPVYDLIVDNPWEKEEDRLKTLKLLLEIPQPYHLNLFSLTFYPGTELYERAKAEGLFQDEINDVYQKNYLKMEQTYSNYLVKLLQFQAPFWLIRLLLKDWLRKRNWILIPRLIYQATVFGRLIGAGFRALLHGDFGSFGRAIRARLKKPAQVYSAELLKKDDLSLHS